VACGCACGVIDRGQEKLVDIQRDAEYNPLMNNVAENLKRRAADWLALCEDPFLADKHATYRALAAEYLAQAAKYEVAK